MGGQRGASAWINNCCDLFGASASRSCAFALSVDSAGAMCSAQTNRRISGGLAEHQK
jgi:hypothetical protein